MSLLSKTIKKKHTTTQSTSNEETMSKCPKCGESVYFAERITILGKDWHSRCLRCDNCDKALTPGQHSAHLNKPYCNGCYQAMYGPEGFRQGTVEPRRVTIKGALPARRDTLSKSDTKAKIKEYNLYKKSAAEKLKSRENNGQIFFEGTLRLYWGLKRPITLSPGVMYNKRQSSVRGSIVDFSNMDDEAYQIMLEEAEKEKKKREIEQEKSDRKLHEIVSSGWNSQDRMPKLSRDESTDDLTQSLPTSGFELRGLPGSLPGTLERRNGQIRSDSSSEETDGNSMSISGRQMITRGNSMEPGVYNSRSPVRKRSASFRKISKQKRIEGKTHSEMRHQFIPPYGSPTNVRVTSTIPTKDVILMLIAKYKVENPISEFALCVIYDTGYQEYLADEEYPLMRRLKLGPSEDISKIFIVEADTGEKKDVLSEEVATWIKFPLIELQRFARKYEEEEEKEKEKIRKKFKVWQEAITEQLQNGRTISYPVTETDV